jgi:ABC-2 type transport system permease protein
MLLFVYVFGGAISTGTDSYVTYLLPGILLIAIASGIASVLWAHVLTSLVANGIAVVMIVSTLRKM